MSKQNTSNMMKIYFKKFLVLFSLIGLSAINANAVNYYTFISGDWSNSAVWTTDPTGLTSVGAAVPGAADAVFIINNRVVTNTLVARTVVTTSIASGATLDLGTITGNNLGTVSGTGLLKISSTSFPSGTFTAFVSASGGTVEYYNFSGTLPNTFTYNNLTISNSTASANTIVFANGTNPTNYTLNGNLTLSNTGSGSLQAILGNAATNVINLIVNNTVNVSAGVTFKAGNFNAIHQIEVFNNFFNSGTVQFSNSPQFSASTNGAIDLKFSGLTNAFLSCNSTTNLYTLIVNKGVDVNTSLQISASSSANFQLFTDGDALQMLFGTLRLGLNVSLTRVNGGGLFTIPVGARLWIDGAAALINGNAGGIQVNGELKISAGSFSIGNEGIITGLNGSVAIDGGSSTIEKLRPVSTAGAHTSSFNMSAGTLTVDGSTSGTSNADFPRFCMPYTSQAFFMTGGTLNIANPETGTALGGGLLLGCSSFSVTNGTVNLTIPASSTNFVLNSSVSFFNLNIIKAGVGTGSLILSSQPVGAGISLSSPIAARPLVIRNDLSLVTGNNPVLDANGNNISVRKNFNLNTGTTYTPGNNSTIFNGTSTQFFNVNGTITSGLFNLTINKVPTTTTCFLGGSATSLTILNDITITSGTFNNSNKRVDIIGNIFNNGLLNGLGAFTFIGTGAQTIGGNGSGRIQNMNINKSGGSATLVASMQLEGNLRLISGILDLDIYTFTVNVSARIYDALTGTTTTGFNSTKMIRTAGTSSSGGIRKRYNASNKSFLYPLGAASKYTPASINISGSPTTYGTISIRAINTEHPVVTALNQSLKYHWKTSSAGFVLGAATVEHIYTYDQSDVVTGVGIDETEYVAAYYLPFDVQWVSGDVTEVDEATNRIIIDPNVFGQIIDGEFTAGDRDPDDPFDEVIAFYSTKNGNWEDASLATTPWSVVNHSGPATNLIPGPKNPVFVGDGVSFFHTITVTANGAKSGNLFMGTGSTLDIGTKTGHNFSVLNGFNIAGGGTLRISSATSTAEFPAGDFGLFLGNTGGTVEYYTTSIDFNIPTTSALPSAIVLNSYNFLTVNPGVGRTITMPNLDLSIASNFRVIGAGNCFLNNSSAKTLNITGAMILTAGVTRLRNNFAQTINVTSNLNISAGATFDVATTGTAVTNVFNHLGAISNNGTLDLNAGSGRVCDYFSTGTGNRSISGTNNSAITEFNKVTIDRGTSAVNEYNFDVRGTFITPTNNWLTLINGTAKFSRAYNITLTDQAVPFTIPSTTKLVANSAGLVINIGVANNNAADLILAGKLQVDAGTINIGLAANTANNDIEYSAVDLPEIEVKGSGVLMVNGQIRRSTTLLTGALTYKQSDNSTVTINGASAAASRAKFEIVNLGSSFSMSGNSTLKLVRGGGSSFGDLYLEPATSSITGGTILCEPGAIGSAQIYSIDALVPIFNLTVNGNSAVNTATIRPINNPLTVSGNLLINNNFSVFDANGIAVNLLANLVNNNNSAATGITSGGFRASTNSQITTFASSTANQTISGVSGNLTNFANLVINNSFLNGLVTLNANTSIRVNKDLTLTQGTLADGGNLITCISDIFNSSTHASTGSGKVVCQGAVQQFIGGNGNGKFGNLTIDNATGVATSANQTVNNILNLNNGSLFINAYVLKLAQTATVTGTFSGTRMIQTNGLSTDSGVVKFFNSGAASFLFPVGSDLNYMPAQYTITANTAAGTIRVTPVKTKHPATTDNADKQLNYYWVVRATGFAGLNATHQYNYEDAFVTGSEAAYVTGRYVAPQWNPTGGMSSTVNASANTMTITGVNYIDGEYTCGETSEFQLITTLYSRNATLGGDWDSPTTWSVTDHNGVASGITPTFQIVKIASGHTITTSANNRTCSTLTIDGTLDVNNNTGNNFGIVDGTGLLKISATPAFSFVFPLGNFNQFNSSTGGTVEYYGTQLGSLLPNLNYNNLVFSGNSNKTLSNVDIIVNGNFTINDGVVDNSVFNKNITLFKNWNNNVNSSAFVPGNSDFNLNGSNQTIGGTASTTFHNFKVNTAGTKTLGRAIALNNNLTISAGVLDVSASNFGIDIKGNFTNNASFEARQGKVTLNGTAAQQIIGGSSNTSFFDVDLNNFFGAKLGSIQSLQNTLTCITGTFDFSPHRLILTSNLTRTGRIAPLSGGNITGNITMQRLAPGGLTGWAFIGTPVQNAKINQWTDNFLTSGFTGAQITAGGFISIFTYNESDLGAFGATTSYAAITDANVDDITPGVGYWVYLGTSTVSTSNILIDVTGPSTKGNFDFNVSFTSSGSIADDGYNLVANPYPSAIDWDSPSWTKSALDNAIYIWQADLSQYATYINGVSTNGGSNLIPSSQGFFVKANGGGPILSATENVKVAGNPTFIKSGNSLTSGAMLRAKIEGNNFKDEAIVRFNENATLEFDGQFDATKIYSSNAQVPSVAFVTGDKDYSVNTLPEDEANLSIPVRVIVGVSGNYTLSFEGVEVFDNKACIVFEDLKTGAKTNIKELGTYQFYIDSWVNAPRFVIHIAKSPKLAITDASCSNLSDGAIEITNNNNLGSWLYMIKDSKGETIAQNTASNAVVSNLSADKYTIAFDNGNACAYLNNEVTVHSKIAINAQITSTTPVETSEGIQVDFLVNAPKSATLTWNFGDGEIVEGASSMRHIFKHAGDYKVSVSVTDDICKEELGQTLTLVSNKFNKPDAPLVSRINDQFLINFNFSNPTDVAIKVTDALGKEVMAMSKTVSSDRITMSTAALSEGIYFVNIVFNGQTQISKMIK